MKIRELEWVQEAPGKFIAYGLRDGFSPNDGRFSILLAPNEPGGEDLYWAAWNLRLPGTKDLQSLKDEAQSVHEANVQLMLEKWVE